MKCTVSQYTQARKHMLPYKYVCPFVAYYILSVIVNFQGLLQITAHVHARSGGSSGSQHATDDSSGLPWHTSAALDVRDWCSRLGRDSTGSQAERCGKESFLDPPPMSNVDLILDVYIYIYVYI